MAVGPFPNAFGVLVAGAVCASCCGQNSADKAAKFQDYAGQFGPSGLPDQGCESQSGTPCDQSKFFKPNTGAPTCSGSG
jgi:hypothetical protein